MKKTLIAALLGATLLTGTAFAAQDGPPPPPRPDPLAHADTNHDGVVTREELFADVDARFARMDANHDGKISADERGAMQERRQARMKGRGGKMAKRMLGRIDTNGDGAISLDEQRAQATRRFDMIDANHDGRIDQVERDQVREKMMAMRGSGRPHRGNEMPPPPPAGAPDGN